MSHRDSNLDSDCYFWLSTRFLEWFWTFDTKSIILGLSKTVGDCVLSVNTYYNNNQWYSVVYRVLDQRRLFWHTKEKFRNTKRNWVFLIFLKCVKIASVGLKLDRPQLQHWLLFSECNWPTPKSENSKVVGLPVPMGYDCVCASACVSSSPSDFEWCSPSSSFSRIWIKQAPALEDLKRHSYNNQTNV